MMTDLRVLVRHLCESACWGPSEPAAWFCRYFIRNYGWQLVLAGLATGVFVHTLVCTGWIVGRRQRPYVRWHYFILKLVTWLVVPYGATNVFGFLVPDQHRPWFGPNNELLICAVYLAVRVPVVLFVLRKKDVVPFEFAAAMVEPFLMLSIMKWIIANVFPAWGLT